MAAEEMQYDVVIVGAGPAGLAAAIRLKQLDDSISVCVVEKAATIGGHIVSGCVFEPRAINELMPDWLDHNPPNITAVTRDEFAFLTKDHLIEMPLPPQMHNEGNFIISLSAFTSWLGEIAQNHGVEVYPGFAAAKVLYENDNVVGIETGEMGLDKHGQPTANHQPGVAIKAKQTLFAEGARGSLSEQVIKKYNLREGRSPQTYGLGIKEVWQVLPGKATAGRVFHSIGWPLDQRTYGGSFIYDNSDDQVTVGFVAGLDYRNPHMSVFEEFQRFKTHPLIKKRFAGGKRLAYGARALNEGGWQSVPHLTFPGGALIGCAAGFLNVPKIKGTHTAMKSGMLAAEGAYEFLNGEQNTYQSKLEHSWVAEELRAVRNIRPGFRFGLWAGLANAAIVTYLTKGKETWTLSNHADHEQTLTKSEAKPISYPKPDGVLTFDKLSSVYLCNVEHREDQPKHLVLKNPDLAIANSYHKYASPEVRYCPANVYEIVQEPSGPRLQINGANCIHCKTCDIKDVDQNIKWVVPEGGSGPNYDRT